MLRSTVVALSIVLTALVGAWSVTPSAERGSLSNQASSAQAVLSSVLFYGSTVFDPVRQELWSISLDGVELRDARSGQVLHTVELEDWRWAGEPHTCDPGLILGPAGELIVSSDVLPWLWRIDPKTLQATIHRPRLDADHEMDVGFASFEYAPHRGVFFGIDHWHGSLWEVDPDLETARKVVLDQPVRRACKVNEPSTGFRGGDSPVQSLCVQTVLGDRRIDLSPQSLTGRVVESVCR